MLKDFFAALLHEMILSLKEGKEFKGPAVFKDYLKEASEAELVSDLKLVLQIINGVPLQQLNLKKSRLMKAACEFFATAFASKMEELPNRFYLLSFEQRVEGARRLIESESLVAEALREILVHHSYQEIAAYLEELVKAVSDADMILVQLPCEIEPEFKRELRQFLQKEHPLSFPIFQINRNLIGGFRLFVNGESIDKSWFAKILKLSSLT